VNREIALSIDNALACAGVLLQKARDTSPEDAVLLRRIVDSVRQIKASVSDVGQELSKDAALGAVPTPLALAGKRILLVEPEEQMRRQAHLLLTRLGARVETAATATEGLAMAEETPYDAIFLDVKPPDMGGFECYRRFRAARPNSSVALTTGFGYDVAHSIVKARADGMRHVLFKPFRQDQVVPAALDGPPVAPR
jgi:CheY-like chemotaxis protein